MIKQITSLIFLTLVTALSAQQHPIDQIESAIIESNFEIINSLLAHQTISKKDKERLLKLSDDIIIARQEKVSHHTMLMSLPISTCVSAGILSYCAATFFNSASRTITKFTHASLIKEPFTGVITLEKIACTVTAGFVTSCAALALWIKAAGKVRSHYQELETDLIDAIKIYQKISQVEPAL